MKDLLDNLLEAHRDVFSPENLPPEEQDKWEKDQVMSNWEPEDIDTLARGVLNQMRRAMEAVMKEKWDEAVRLYPQQVLSAIALTLDERGWDIAPPDNIEDYLDV